MAGTSFVTSQSQSEFKDHAHSSHISSSDFSNRVDKAKSKMKPENLSLSARSGNEDARKSKTGLRVFSPMNENGCYEFDRVLKSGNVQKRTRKTKSWKPIHLVLRPQTLSIYADADGTKLRHQIQLSDITSVARQRDPKRRERHVFALFSCERNYHIECASELEASQWVEMIRTQARIDEDEDEIIALMSPIAERPPGMDSGFFGSGSHASAAHRAGETSASEVETSQPVPIPIRKSRSRNDMHSSQGQRKSSVGLSYLSGADAASYSDFSDAGQSTLSLHSAQKRQAEKEEHARKIDQIYQPSAQASQGADRPKPQRSTSAISARGITSPDNERVVFNGYLYMLKSKRGMRQWKSIWAVLRGSSLALYKNEEEYKPLYIIPFSSIVDAVDIDNLSKNKKHCFQVITEEKHLKFCARSEEEVAKWVGGFKALLAKRRERRRHSGEEQRRKSAEMASNNPPAIRASPPR